MAQLYKSLKIPLPQINVGQNNAEPRTGNRDWYEKVTDAINQSGQIEFDVRDFGARLDGNFDDTNAIKRAIEEINNQSYRGGIVRISDGTARTTSTITVGYSNIWIVGNSHQGTTIAPEMTDGSYAMVFADADENRINEGGGIRNVRIHGQDNEVAGLQVKRVSLARFENLEVRSVKSVAIDLEAAWDNKFLNVLVRSSGTSTDNVPALRMRTAAYSGTTEACNRVLFLNGHWESNNGSDVYMDDPVDVDFDHGLCQWHGCKFHGIGGLALASHPVNPAMRLKGNRHVVSNGYFFLCNDDFIQVDADRCVVSNCVVNNSSRAFSSISGDLNTLHANNVENVNSFPLIEVKQGNDNYIEIPAGQPTASFISDAGTETVLYGSADDVILLGNPTVVGDVSGTSDSRQRLVVKNDDGNDTWLSMLPGDTISEIHFHAGTLSTGNIRGRIRYENTGNKMEFWVANTEQASFDSLGRLNLPSPTVPATGSAAGFAGDFSWDADYIYLCASANSWLRAPLEGF